MFSLPVVAPEAAVDASLAPETVVPGLAVDPPVEVITVVLVISATERAKQKARHKENFRLGIISEKAKTEMKF
ncbi:hypothetical protein GCK72_005536 [Caenorhabditis remanei]|uniref:Uncharacterized protein n=1 Tax=Caenorhabditis remanei TaxID=31234 RepID=A0A6A5HFU0_CAERE|nr:hypothetical protein GCK72_005536 [Caenorhabditis remanei]KAF1765584.1 hypothetical protein GCK72_005536 [Caenorhabditis remanei]